MDTGRATQLGCLILWLGVLTASARAVDVTLTDGDTIGNSSFDAAAPNDEEYSVRWDNNEFPTAGNDYFTSNFGLRTPADGGSYTFAGDSLTVNNTNFDPDDPSTPAGGLWYKGTGDAGTITVDQLILDGGYIGHLNGTGDLFNLAGNVEVATDSYIHARQGPIDVSAVVSGSGSIINPQSDGPGRTLTFQSPNNTYNGDIVNDGRFELADDAVMNFTIGADGVNNSISGSGAETNFNGDFVFDLSGASSNPGDSWEIVSATNQAFGETFSVNGFTQSGDFWTSGSYLFNTTNGVLSISEPPVSWNVDGGGDWGTASNWLDGNAPQAGDDIVFGGVLTEDNAPATINLDTPASASRITFSNTNQYIVSGTNALTLTDLAQLSAGSGTHEVAAVVAGSTGLTKTGTGDVILSADNTYTGLTDVQEGALRIAHAGAVDGDVNIEAGAALFFQGDEAGGGFNGSFAGDLSGDGEVGLSGTLTTETVTFANAKSHTGQTTINGGTLEVSHAAALGAGDGTADTRTLVDGNEATGKLALTGGITVSNEVLTLEARELSAVDAVHLTSAGTNRWEGNIKGELGGTQYNIESTAGTLTLDGTLSAPDTATRDFVFSGAGDVDLAGRLVDSVTDADGNPAAMPVNDSNNVNVFKRGTGTLTVSTGTLDANDFWRGSTVIEQGTLAVDDPATANAGELYSSTIEVQSGAVFDVSGFSGTYNLQVTEDPDTIPFNGDEIGQTLTGSGTIQTGSATLGAFEDSVIEPGDAGAGTLTVDGNLSINQSQANPNGALNYELSEQTTAGGDVNDLVDVSGDLQLLADGAAGGGQFKLNVTVAGAALDSSGSYTLFDAGSTAGSTATSADFDVMLLNTQGTALDSRQDDAAVVAVGASDVTVDFSAAASHTWTGATDGTWDVGTTANWSSSDNLFFDLDSVSFGDGSGQTTVDIVGPVTPGGLTFTADTHTFTGDGIEGGGDVALGAGAGVILANDGSSISGDVSLAGGATLQQGDGASNGTTVLLGEVSGSGEIRVESGTLQLSGDNSYTSVTTINGGTLNVDSATALGSVAAGTMVNGGSLRSNGDTYTTNEPVTLNGGSLAIGGGGPAAVTFAGTITVGAGGGTIQVDGDTGDDGLTVSGDIVGSSGAALNANVGSGSTATATGNISNDGALHKDGPGSLALAGDASISSPNINVDGGTLDVSGLNSTFTVANGQTLDNNSTVAGDMVAADGATIAGTGTFADNVSAQAGSVVRVGGAGLPTIPSQFMIDDFEGYGLGGVIEQATPPWTDHEDSTFADIEDDGTGNQTLAYGHDDASDPAFGAVSRPIPADGVVGDTETATFFFRLNAKQDDPDHSFGVSAGTDTGTGFSFDSYEAQIAFVDDDDPGNGTFNLVARNGGAFDTVMTGLTPDSWNNIWIVVDQTTDTYDVYHNTGTGDATGGDQIASGLAFRNGTAAELNTLLGAWAPAPIDNQVQVDDVAYLNGVDLTNPRGGLSPGEVFQSETMTVEGDLTLEPDSTLALDIYDPETLDLLSVTGNLAAEGTLQVTLEDSAPSLESGDMFSILEFGSASGAFDVLDLPALGSGLVWNTSELLTTGDLAVVSALLGDYNQNGIVDAADYTVWRDTLGSTTDLRADGNGNNVVDAADYQLWKGNFGMIAGSGSAAGQGAAVPEPATWGLAWLVACCAALACRWRLA